MGNVAQENEKSIAGVIKINEKGVLDHIDGLVRQHCSMQKQMPFATHPAISETRFGRIREQVPASANC